MAASEMFKKLSDLVHPFLCLYAFIFNLPILKNLIPGQLESKSNLFRIPSKIITVKMASKQKVNGQRDLCHL